MDKIKLSVIIPAYNESKNLNIGVLDQVYDYLKKQSYGWEVLIIDDGSTDETVALVKQQIKNKEGFRLIKNTHGGKAITVITGMLDAKGEIAVFTDMDQATPIDQIESLFPKFDEGYDLVIGSRDGREGAPLMRKLIAWGFAILRNIILGVPFKDTQCGFKAFKKVVIQEIFPELLKIWVKRKATGAAVHAGFDVEALFLAKKSNFEIAEVPVQWHYVGTERVQVIKDSIDAIRDMFRIRLADIRGKYD